MSAISTHDTVGHLVAERPSRSRIFERWGLDYCCGGKKPLDQACAEKSIDLHAVMRDLLENDTRPPADPETDWLSASLDSLADHIVETHHAYLREALPRLSELTRRVRDAHGEKHPELVELAATFMDLRYELENHMMKEEIVLFPLVKTLEASDSLPPIHCGSVNNPIRVMEMEHDDAATALTKMRALTGDYTPPADACNTYLAMLDALEELEADMHQHIHKENNILFPRAAALEAALEAK
jgi:regulator of cell morphogenesis and NO signaling